MTDLTEVERMIDLLAKASEALRGIAAVADTCQKTLVDSARTHEAIKAHRTPGDYVGFLSYLEEAEPDLFPYFKTAVCDRFDMGRLWLTVSDHFALCHLQLMSPMIAGHLKHLYGCAFKVRASAPREARPDIEEKNILDT